ncbi:hypothetical protein LEP1GSC040_4020 [Leptospira santarosai str. 2000030832]|nr:hypothetical protein LEP1GSC040_4020 [Leptospira santarosai str. 2000030832]
MSAIDIRKTSYEKIFGLPAVFPLKKKRTVWKRFPYSTGTNKKKRIQIRFRIKRHRFLTVFLMRNSNAI